MEKFHDLSKTTKSKDGIDRPDKLNVKNLNYVLQSNIKSILYRIKLKRKYKLNCFIFILYNILILLRVVAVYYFIIHITHHTLPIPHAYDHKKFRVIFGKKKDDARDARDEREKNRRRK